MGWTKPSKNYIIATLIHDRTALDELARYFSGMEGVTIIDLLGMRESLARKFISAYAIDIALIGKEMAGSGQDFLVNDIIGEAEAERNGVRTHFVNLYDSECAGTVKELGEVMLKKKLPLTTFRLDNKADYEILAQTIHGIINEMEQVN